MQIKNPNGAFKPVTVTFEDSAEYESFRRILNVVADILSFEGKESDLFGLLHDEFNANDLDN